MHYPLIKYEHLITHRIFKWCRNISDKWWRCW